MTGASVPPRACAVRTGPGRLSPGLAQVLRFGLVGCVGFLADTAVLLVVAQGLSVAPLPARGVSFLCAATLTFWLNRRYTFRADGAAGAQWLRYVLATGAGALINIGTYWFWISLAGAQPLQLVAGSALGSLVAMVFNYLVSRALVFRAPAARRPMSPPARRWLALPALAGYAMAVAAGLYMLVRTGVPAAGLSGADEPAHLLNGYFVSLYLKSQLGANPLAFAKDFYLHYPKISIGHWPPAYYGFLGVVFLAVPATVANAFVINLLVSALPAAGVALALARVTDARTALLGALVYALTPLVLGSYSFFMLDQAMAACTTAAAIVWVAYATRPTWVRAFSFALLVAFAILVKGNGWLLLLMPVVHIALTRSWRLLRRPELWAAAALAAVLVVPWYLLTSKISADGFNYQPGLAYALRALDFNADVLRRNVGIACLPLGLLGLFGAWRTRRAAPMRWSVASGCVGLIAATLALQSLVPVDLAERYLTPALPAVVVMAFLGVHVLREMLAARGLRAVGALAGAGLALLLLLPGIDFLGRVRPKVDLHMAAAVPALPAATPSGWLIDGTSGAEGAFVAAMALRDGALAHYAVRASKLLADSNFMGTQYRLKYAGASEALDAIERLGLRGAVVVRIADEPAFAHSTQLVEALALPGSPFRHVRTIAHDHLRGTTEVYRGRRPRCSTSPRCAASAFRPRRRPSPGPAASTAYAAAARAAGRPASRQTQYISRSGRMSLRMVVAISSIDLCVDDSQSMPSRRIMASAADTS